MNTYVLKLTGNRIARNPRFKNPIFISVKTKECLAEGRKLKIDLYDSSIYTDFYYAEVVSIKNLRKVEDYNHYNHSSFFNPFLLLIFATKKKLKLVTKRNLIHKLKLKFDNGILTNRDRGTFKRITGDKK